MNWLNGQNKKHIFLFQRENWLKQAGDLEYRHDALFNRANRMNRRLSKLSPRRHKKANDRLFRQILNNECIAVDITELSHIFDETEE